MHRRFGTAGSAAEGRLHGKPHYGVHRRDRRGSVLQAGILVAMYLAMRKSSARIEALAIEVKTKALPTLETAQAMLN